MAIYQVTVKGTLSGSGALRNVAHYLFPDYDPDSTQKLAFVNELDSKIKNRLQTLFHTGVQVNTYGMRRVDSPNQPEIDVTPTAGAWFGTLAGNQLPEMNSALVTWKAFAQFPRTTRTYMFPFSVAASTSTAGLTAGALTQLNSYATDMLNIVVSGAATAQKVAVKFTGTPRVVTSFNVVTAAAVAGRFRTQRRRRLGVGA